MPEDGDGNRLVEAARQLPQRVVQAHRDRQRKRAARGRKRGFNRALVALLVVLLGLFFWSISSIFSAPAPGQQVSLDELSALSANNRVASATFRDVDNRIVGTYVGGTGVTNADPRLP